MRADVLVWAALATGAGADVWSVAAAVGAGCKPGDAGATTMERARLRVELLAAPRGRRAAGAGGASITCCLGTSTLALALALSLWLPLRANELVDMGRLKAPGVCWLRSGKGCEMQDGEVAEIKGPSCPAEGCE